MNSRSLLVWLEDGGVGRSLFSLLFRVGRVAVTAAKVGRRMFSGNPGCWRIVLVVRWCVSGVFRR